MATPPSPASDFLAGFQHIFTRTGFRGVDFRTHLARPANQRSGDEASIVDRAIVGPLLELLGFAPGDQNYNVQRRGDRPDYAPSVAVYGTCFVVESKNTTTTLTLNPDDPESSLGQLWGYMQLLAVDLGVLTNGREIRVYERIGTTVRALLYLDMEPVLTAWANGTPLAADLIDTIMQIERQCSLASFTDPDRMERELGMELDKWLKRALPLGTEERHEAMLVFEVQQLISTLHADARQILQRHREAAATYERRRRFLADVGDEDAEAKLTTLRDRVLAEVEGMRATLGVTDEQKAAIQAILIGVATEGGAYPSKKALVDAVLLLLNEARAEKYAEQPRFARPWRDLDPAPNIKQALDAYSEVVAAHLKRQTELRLSYRESRSVMEDFGAWRSLIQETALGSGTEEQQANEFALQAAYVIFIRLLLIRVCEDKGLFPNRFVSDGGLKHWQEDIDRYLRFASGNPYTPLLDMAYANAQNIYAHFFTGREVFNWYRLDRRQLLMALHRLSRFNFANVNADIVGTIYNTYVERKEKKERGQYYTPRPIVDYMLTAVGYTEARNIIGPDKRLIDPACGSGSFLVAAAHRLVTAYRANPRRPTAAQILQRVRDSLFGFDLNPFACYLAEVNLLIQVLDLVKEARDQGHRQSLERFHIYNEDALTNPTSLFSYSRYQTRLVEESAEADQIKRRAPGTPYASGFAFIVANPPYGAALSDDYKATLRKDWSDVFYGQPDTYVFFFALAVQLLATRGRMAFITPNTYLMGTNSVRLRRMLLTTGKIEEIIDLPQGIWDDATVDCTILVLTRETDEAQRRAKQPIVRLMGLRDDLNKLSRGEWQESLVQRQEQWIDDPKAEMNIRYDDLIQRIEDACRVPSNGSTKINRLGDVTESTQGIIPYQTQAESLVNAHIRPRRDVPSGDPTWHPLLDTHSSVGRYSLRWGEKQHYLHYGDWLCRPREERFFTSSKIILIRFRNKALKRRLVGTFDEGGYYLKENYNAVIAHDPQYDLKYLLALFNSSLLNYWYARRNDQVTINPIYFRQIPIFPADATTQAEIAQIVDQLLTEHAELNLLRDQGYAITRRSGGDVITLPYDRLFAELQAANPDVAAFRLLDALYQPEVVSLPEGVDETATVSSNIYVPQRYPTSVVLRHNKLWLTVPDADLREYLVNYLSSPRWRGKPWAQVSTEALMPVNAEDRAAFAALVQARQAEIVARLDRIDQLDREIDQRVLVLYGITDPGEQARVLGSAPPDDEAVEAEGEAAAPVGEAQAGQAEGEE
jgi:type I restriction-modification system DNA methylase subunit